MEKSLEHSALEQEIKNLSAEIKERGTTEQGREAVRAIIQEKISASPMPNAVPSQTAKSATLPDYLDKESPEVKLKVEKLLEMALHKGIKAAASEARSASPLVVDAFHDALTDKLYRELKTRGLIK